MRQAIALRLLFAVVDLVGLLGAFVLAYTLRVHVFPAPGEASVTSFTPYMRLFLVIGVLWMWAAVEARLLGLHELPYEEEVVRLIRGLGLILAIVLLLLTMMKVNYAYSRLIVFGGFSLAAIVMSINRVLLRALLERVDATQPSVLVVCAIADLPEAVCRHLRLRASNHKMLGVVLPNDQINPGMTQLDCGELQIPILGDLDSLDALVDQMSIEQVDIVLHAFDSDRVMDIASTLEGRIPFMTLHPDPADILVANSEALVEAGAINLHLHQNLVNPINRATKRVFDLLFSFAVLVSLSPLYLMLALIIRVDSRGPIFYVQQRLGQDRRHFGCLKFRTMQVDAAERLEALLASDEQARAEWEADHKLKNDPRITRLGNWIRKTSLDELPQFLNVLLGHMSVVGPRPIVDDEVEKYARWGHILFRVKPGITGLWQVSGRNDVTYDERIMFDRFYVKNWSFRLDLTIIVKTVFTVLARRGAY